MTTRRLRTRQARQDLIDIWRHVAQDSPTAADALLDRLDGAEFTLAAHPIMGPSREDIRPGLRYFPVGRYIILYRALDDGVEIVRIVHGHRDLRGLG